jgi:hypothetical protein
MMLKVSKGNREQSLIHWHDGHGEAMMRQAVCRSSFEFYDGMRRRTGQGTGELLTVFTWQTGPSPPFPRSLTVCSCHSTSIS